MNDKLLNKKEIANAYIHVNNGGMNIRIIDEGQGPTIVTSYGHFGYIDFETKFNVSKNSLRQLKWVCIKAISHKHDWEKRDPPKVRIKNPEKLAAFNSDFVKLMSPTGKIHIGYEHKPGPVFVIKGSSHGVPEWKRSVELNKRSFLDLAMVFHHALRFNYSEENSNGYDVSEGSFSENRKELISEAWKTLKNFSKETQVKKDLK